MSPSRQCSRPIGIRPSARTRQLAQQLAGALVCALLLPPGLVSAEPVDVRYTEGSFHGFLVLRAADGKVAAEGDAIQSVRSDQVTVRLVFRFRDGSLQDETTVYSQRRQFKLVSYRLAQKGPTFAQPLEMSVDGLSGQVRVRHTNEKGEQKVENEHFDVPPDLANGM